ncbi:MAG: hypothetical protein HC932_04805 [Thermales bacterium]|nr:hypothetical protein [Thermales bacterium]
MSTYFMYISSWVIGVFCPWCILSAISSTAIFFLLQTIFLKHNSYNFSKNINQKVQSFLNSNHNIHITLGWYLFIFALSYLPFILAKI